MKDLFTANGHAVQDGAGPPSLNEGLVARRGQAASGRSLTLSQRPHWVGFGRSFGAGTPRFAASGVRL